MSTRYSPTIRRRRLSAELKRCRYAASMTLDDVAADTEISRSTIGNIESGEKKYPKIVEVRALLDAYGVDDEREREEILTLCRQARERGWWSRYTDALSAKYVGFETEASVISTWEPLVIPGLLQVPSYVEVTAQAVLAEPADMQRVVDARMTRQRILEEDPPELWAIFDEHCLARLDAYPEVRDAQVKHLLELAIRPTITIQMTQSRQLNPGSGGPFVILEFPTTVDPTVVYLETDTDGIYLEEPPEVARYRRLINHLRLSALKPGETIARLQELSE